MADSLAGGGSKLQAANAAAMRAMELLSPRDRVGVISFNESPQWTIGLTQKRKCNDASLKLAATSPQGGTAIGPALEAAYDALAKLSPDEAGVRHVLLMTDGVSEPADYDAILSKMTAAKITLSTVAVGGDADCLLLGQLARHGGGFAYNAGDANHLCDAFVHDAALLRRPMIVESAEGIAVVADARSSGISGVQGLRLGGMVLSSVKPAANVEVLLRAAGSDGDPVLTRWQCGLGQTAVFAGDATARWGRGWVKSAAFAKFWPQLVRSVARGGANQDFDVRTVRDGPRTRIIVEAIDSDAGPQRFLTINGKFAGPDVRKVGADMRLSQTGPGTYEATMDTPDAGTYCATLAVQSGAERRGTLVAAGVVNAAAELRDLQSNDALLARVAAQTGGRVLATFDRSADLFSREGLQPSVSSQPIDHLLLPMLMSILLADVAVRRLAWDWQRMRWLAGLAVGHVRGFFAMRSAESLATLAALREVRSERAGQKF
ncbi:MAG TPA: vWA domain-containing protein, partial [Tepidisphaeraceae bacterium]